VLLVFDVLLFHEGELLPAGELFELVFELVFGLVFVLGFVLNLYVKLPLPIVHSSSIK
jgi:hypothetical protein